MEISKTEKRKAFNELENAIRAIIQAQGRLQDYSYEGNNWGKKRGKYKELMVAIEKITIVRNIVLRELSSL